VARKVVKQHIRSSAVMQSTWYLYTQILNGALSKCTELNFSNWIFSDLLELSLHWIEESMYDRDY
jgi:hypothetical protein